MEWTSSDSAATGPTAVHGCFRHRLGHSPGQSLSARPLASVQTPQPHQHEGVARGVEGTSPSSSSSRLAFAGLPRHVSAKAYLDKFGGTRLAPLNALAMHIWQHCFGHRITLTTLFVLSLSHLRLLLVPPWNLIDAVLRCSRLHQQPATLITPNWPREKGQGSRYVRSVTFNMHADPLLCPVRAFGAYRRATGFSSASCAHPVIAGRRITPLFRMVIDHDCPVTADTVRVYICNVRRHIGRDPPYLAVPKARAFSATLAAQADTLIADIV